MADKHVHWAHDVVFDDDENRESFVPPPLDYSPPFPVMNADDDDSIADSPSPATPPAVLAPINSTAHIFQTHHHSRPVPRAIQVSTRPVADGKNRSPGVPSWSFGEASPSSDKFRMTETGRSLPPFNTLSSSKRKPSASQERRASTRTPAPVLYRILAHPPSTSTPALVWNVGDSPSSSTVLMTSPNDSWTLVPVPEYILHAPATNPPQREMRVSCVGNSLWEPLVVRTTEAQSPPRGVGERQTGRPTRAPASPAGEHVTVMHVIREIYRYLHIRMTDKEYEALGTLPAPGFQRSVAKSFYERCDAEERRSLAQRALPERSIENSVSPLREHSGANLSASTPPLDCLRRLDCLLGQTHFLGLSKVADGSGGWYMNVGDGYR